MNLNIPNFMKTIGGLSVVSAVVLVVLRDIDFNQLTSVAPIMQLISAVIAVDGFFWLILSTWAWKLRVVQGWLIPFPNLNGTWAGELISTWVNEETDEQRPKHHVELTIKQTITHVNCVHRTEHSVSRSFISGFVWNPDDQLYQLVYSYSNDPLAGREDSRGAQHKGTCVLNIGETDNKRSLVGNYWTDRRPHGTRGSMELTFWTEKQLSSYSGPQAVTAWTAGTVQESPNRTQEGSEERA